MTAPLRPAGRPGAGWTGDGVIAGLGEWEEPVKFVKTIRAQGVPVVDLYNATAHELDLPRVLGDHRAAGRLAAEHFLERGWRHFAWFSRGRHVEPSLRLHGYADHLAGHGHSVLKLGADLQDEFARNRWDKINAELARELTAAPKPLAVFAQNDLGAVAIMEACDTAGLRTPEDVETPLLDPLSEAGGGSVQEKQGVYMRELIEKLNELFGADTTEQDQLVYVNHVIKGKLLESETLRQQAANNTKEQFSNSPDLNREVQNATMASLDAHTAMATHVLNSSAAQKAVIEILLNHAHLWEALRAKAAS